MFTPYVLPHTLLQRTFSRFRECGRGLRECQVLWLSSHSAPHVICEVVHPDHEANMAGFALKDAWLNAFWFRLAKDGLSVRIQVHTHPGEAFHSFTDDEYPLVHTAGFLSLVIPDFALGQIGFERAYLTEIQPDGSWREVAISERLLVQ